MRSRDKHMLNNFYELQIDYGSSLLPEWIEARLGFLEGNCANIGLDC